MIEYTWENHQKQILFQIQIEAIKQRLQEFTFPIYESGKLLSEIDQIKKNEPFTHTLWKDLPIETSKILFTFEVSDNFKINKNRNAYDIFVNEHLHDPKFQEKYVVFVNEQLKDVADDEVELVKRIHEKYGNIDMYVGKVSLEKTKGIIESPER